MRIFWGLLAVGIFILISFKLKLPMTSWLLQQFLVVGIIILAIVFQPELRTALAELYLPKKIYSTQGIVFIEEIISAVKELTEKKIGALIVFERKIGLKDFTSTGIILNAELKKELLLSIFYPDNPLHDGAVIISKNKILAARCILPLSEEDYCKNYGTRHRAAAGIAHLGDTLVIVVSEETGKITFVQNKNFYYDITIEELRKFLTESLK